MDKITVDFSYEGRIIQIQGTFNEKMKNLYQKFISKAGIDISKKLLFSYNGKWENTSGSTENLTFYQMANLEDKNRKKMSILVAENMMDTPTNQEFEYEKKEIVCPECSKYCLIELENYRISLFGCENGHENNNIPLNQFQNTQHLELNNIFCDKCKKKRAEIFKNTIHKCLKCKKLLCPLCRNEHESSHEIIEYDELNFICEEDNDNFVGYCEECGKHYCLTCEENHDEHEKIDFRDILPKKKELNESVDILKQYINDFDEQCDEIINVLNSVKNNLKILLKIKEKCISGFDIKKKKNYFVFNNLNELKKNDQIIKDINLIKNEISIVKKFEHIVNMYNQINNNLNLKSTKLDVDLMKENEELRRTCNFLKESLDKTKKLQLEDLEIKKKYELIKNITFAGINEETKECEYNMANKCLLIELVLSGYNTTKFIDSDKVAYTMLEVDRGDFAPEGYYLNRPIYIGYNVTISAPHMHAFALEHLSQYCTPGAKILDIGSGSGYLTVALSKMTDYTGVVVGVEHIPQLYNFGIENVKKNHANLLIEKKIIFVNEDGRKGCERYGPYKAIHVGAACEQLPQDIIEQLDYNGRMFIPIGPQGKTQNIYLIDKDINGKVTYRAILSVCYGMLRDKESQLKQN